MVEVCVVDYDEDSRDQDIRLVVEKDKLCGNRDAPARLVVAAMAAFAKTNRYKVTVGLEPLSETVSRLRI